MPTQSDFEHCRTFRHTWDLQSLALATDGMHGVFGLAKLRCTCCTTSRVDEFDADGELLYRNYTYPAGYSWAGEDEKPTLRELRLRLLTRETSRTPPLPDETKTQEETP